MALHPSIKKSFFLKFILSTIIVGNIYLCFQSLFHSLNLHLFDLYLRWYAFNVSPIYNIALLLGTLLTIYGAFKIWKHGMAGYKIYVTGKIIVLMGYIVLTLLEYQAANLSYPFILIPVLTGIEAIYPMVLYISLRKSMAKGSY